MDAAAELNEDAAGGPWAVPEGWCWTQLGHVLPIAYGKALPARDRNEHGEFAVFGSSGRVGAHDKYIAPAHSVLVGRKGSAGAVFYSEQPSWPIDTAYFTSGSPAINIRYGYWFLRFRDLSRLDQSTAIPSLSRDIYDIQYIPVAPLAEQRRIVARIDTLFAEIAEGEAALAEARKGLDTFRRALLKAAVTGELTKDWRLANPASMTGSDVLECIARDPVENARKSRRGGSTEVSRLAKPGVLPLLPENWAWATLGEIGEIVGGITVDKKRKPADPVTVPYLRVANVQRGYVDLSEVKSISVERATAKKLRLCSGDILLNEGGDRDKIGRGWVWDNSLPDAIHQNHVFRVRLRDRAINPFFVSHYANEMGRRFFIEQGKQTTNLASISLSKISTLPVPIPPPAESVEIIQRVSDALAAFVDTLTMLDAETADAVRLKQSVLKAAFEGRLVQRDVEDEPADKLLARLAINPSARASAKRGRKSVV